MHEAPAHRRPRRLSTPHRFTVIPGGRQRSEPAAVVPLRTLPPPFVVLVLGCETFFFFGVLAIAVALRAASAYWPPPTLPPLPVTTTWVYTAILLLSAVTMRRAMAAARDGRRGDVETGLAATALLGFAFIAGQSAELVWLFSAGLAPSVHGYTSAFVALVGGATAHAIGGLLWIVAATTAVAMGDRPAAASGFVRSCAVFWYYGCALWVPLFVVLYLW